jgi:ribose transport system substrate-binding protein
MKQHAWRRPLAALAVVGLVAGVTACGSSDDGGSTGSSGGDTATPPAMIAKAKEEVAKNSEYPTSFGITEPLKTKPTGKVLDYVQCVSPLCAKLGKDVTTAATQLGMKVNIVQGGGTPEEVTAAFNKVVQDKPDAVIDMNYPVDQWREQLGQLKDQGAKVIVNNVPNTGAEGITSYVFNDNDARTTVEQLVWRIIAESDGKANMVYVNAPDAGPGAQFQLDLWKKYMAERCPGCKFNVLNIKATDVGKTVPQTIASYLQAHPDTDIVDAYYGDMFIGVPAALKGAGISPDKVKLISGGGSKINWQYIRDGEQWADRALYLDVYGYQLADIVARAVTGQEYKVPLLPTVWVDKDTPNFDLEQLPFGSDYKKQFSDLWSQAK